MTGRVPGTTRRHSVSVAAVVIDDCQRVLAIKRRDSGAWQPPGGILELDEEIEAGLTREVLEETGVSVWPVALTGLYKHVDRGILSLVYRCRPRPGMPAHETDEAAAISWLSLAEAEHCMDPVFFIRVKDAFDYDLGLRNRGPRVRHHDGVTVRFDGVRPEWLPRGADGAGGLEGAGHAVGVGLTVAGGEHGHVEVGEALE